MVEKWKIALKEFLKQYEEDDDVVGALLFGSYSNNTYNDYSDINVYLVLKNTANYSETGVTESNSYIINYYKKSINEIKDTLHDEIIISNRMYINIFAYGKIIYDLDGSLKTLQDIYNKEIWYELKNLKALLPEERADFKICYYRLLDDIYFKYSRYKCIQRPQESKIYKILTDQKYREKTHVFKLPEEEFIKLYLKCYEEKDYDTMYKNISRLIDYYYTKQGGFNIRTYELKTERKSY